MPLVRTHSAKNSPNLITRITESLSQLAIVLLLFVSCEKNPSAIPAAKRLEVSVRFPIPIIEAGQAPFYVAEDQGFYRDEALDVKFQMGSKELNPIKTVATGQDAFAVIGGPDTLLVARSKGQPLKAIAVLHRNSNFSCLLTLKSTGITKLDQLQGKKIGFYYGHISTDVLRNLLRKGGIRYSEVDVGFDYNQFLKGLIDAQWAFRVTAGLDLPAKGIEVNQINPADYGIISQGYTVFTTDEIIQKNPDLVLRFLRATLRGVKHTVEHPEEANRTLLKRDSTIDEALSLKRLKLYNEVTSNSDKYPPGYMDREMFQVTYDRLTEEKVIEKRFEITDAYTTQFQEELYPRGDLK